MRNAGRSIIIFLFVFLLISSSLNAISYDKKTNLENNFNYSISLSKADIIIPDTYSTIKKAVSNAKQGDTLFVRPGLYEESNIIIDKKINLTGENPETTIIKANNSQTILKIYSDEVIISNFTIYNSGNTINKNIDLSANNCMIKNNIIKGNKSNGIVLLNSSKNIISKNKISDCLVGIYLFNSTSQDINYNMIFQCSKGVYIEESNNNLVEKNHFYFNEIGIFVSYSSDNNIKKNNFIANREHAKFNSWLSPNGFQKNKWNNNYWDKSYSIFPRVIRGIVYIPTNFQINPFLPCIRIDWQSKKEPYNLDISEKA